MIVTATDAPGNYRLRAGGQSDGVDRGFSVNLPLVDSQLERLDEEQLKELMGDIDFRVAKSREQIDRDVSLSRVGRELFPLLIALVAIAARRGTRAGQSVLSRQVTGGHALRNEGRGESSIARPSFLRACHPGSRVGSLIHRSSFIVHRSAPCVSPSHPPADTCWSSSWRSRSWR